MDVDLEKELIASCRRGDTSACGDLIRAHSGRVLAVCFGMLGNRHDAEDVTQQTLLKGFMQIRTLRDSDRFAPWIVRIARNLCVDVLRTRKRRGTPSGLSDLRAEGDPEDYHRLEQALDKLNVDYRVPLLLFYFDGRSTQSIAETQDYWFDPARDYVLMERIQIQQRVNTRREFVRELGQASTGVWYPRVIEVESTNLGPDGVPDRTRRWERRILFETGTTIDDAPFDPATLAR